MVEVKSLEQDYPGSESSSYCLFIHQLEYHCSAALVKAAAFVKSLGISRQWKFTLLVIEMKLTGLLGLIYLLLAVLGSVSGCGSVLENSIAAVSCTTPSTNNFTTMGVRVKSPDGVSRQLSVCYRNWTCTDAEPSGYQATMGQNQDQTAYVLVLRIGSVSRNEKQIQCTTDDIVSSQCTLDVYVHPEKPVCELPKFIEDGTTIYLKCTADRIYPNAKCHFELQDKVVGERVQTSYKASSRYPGDKEVTCELFVPVRGHPPGEYVFVAEVKADVPMLGAGESVNGDEVSLKLSEVALGKSHRDNETFEVEKGSDLVKTFAVTGNPPPTRFSLMMKPDLDSADLTVLDKDYSISYQGGSLQFELLAVGKTGPGFGYYTLRIGNSVGSTWPQEEYKFVLRVKDDGSTLSPLSSEGSDGLSVPVIIGIAVGAAICVILVAVLIVYCLKLKQSKKALERNHIGHFDAPFEPANYIYPNMAFDVNPNDYCTTENPPPYKAQDHTYETTNEYSEIGPGVFCKDGRHP